MLQVTAWWWMAASVPGELLQNTVSLDLREGRIHELAGEP